MSSSVTPNKQWEIIHIPGKPPSPEPETVDILASVVEPKLAHILIRKLNEVCPLEGLRHVKRVRRRTSEGNVELSVILCLSQKDGGHCGGMPNDVLEIVNGYHLSPFNAKVHKNVASTKEEWEEQCKLWPTSYHPNIDLEDVVGFSEEESLSIYSYINDAIQLARLSNFGEKVVNAAVIVDPSTKQKISSGDDQTCLELKECTQQATVIASLQSDANGLENGSNDVVRQVSDENGNGILTSTSPDVSVACLCPWTWVEQRPVVNSGSNYSWHPLRHAALVAIENAAARDRRLFPNSKCLAEHSYDDSLQLPSSSISAKRQKIEAPDNEGRLANMLTCEPSKPYLCTGFDIYLAWEPCTMCAMALVHQRIRRVFYAFPNPKAGALGSVYRLQGEKSLNHHYSVYRILLPEKVLHGMALNGSCNS